MYSVFVEGWTPVWLSQYLVGVLSQMAALPLEDEIVEMLKWSIRLVPAMVSEMMALEGAFIEEAYYFQGDQLVITSQEDGPLVLSRLKAPTTTVRSATWGYINSQQAVAHGFRRLGGAARRCRGLCCGGPYSRRRSGPSPGPPPPSCRRRRWQRRSKSRLNDPHEAAETQPAEAVMTYREEIEAYRGRRHFT